MRNEKRLIATEIDKACVRPRGQPSSISLFQRIKAYIVMKITRRSMYQSSIETLLMLYVNRRLSNTFFGGVG